MRGKEINNRLCGAGAATGIPCPTRPPRRVACAALPLGLARRALSRLALALRPPPPPAPRTALGRPTRARRRQGMRRAVACGGRATASQRPERRAGARGRRAAEAERPRVQGAPLSSRKACSRHSLNSLPSPPPHIAWRGQAAGCPAATLDDRTVGQHKRGSPQPEGGDLRSWRRVASMGCEGGSRCE